MVSTTGVTGYAALQFTERQDFCQDRATNKSFGQPYFERVM
ncbi:MAG: hypothetical protein QF405_07110 [Roseibacillus sp.]|jgi:hypothetical protein|nr:hypothetical protein [Roseibacillus sp.]MDP7655899.1 hypothetical protein [Roseibacillus sp.]HJM64272.1 hypothetical protein [Roseibacillus sp.]